MFRKLAVLGAVTLALALIAPLGSAKGAIFAYYRNGTLINGQIRGECGYQCVTSWYRAGSGSGTDACQHNNWIPIGGYNVTFHDDHYAASIIQGRVWRLTDYHCSNGIDRTELFVHSEETSSQTETCGSPYIEKWCWDGPNDYYSDGCIKVARLPVTNGYSDLGRIDNFHHSISGPVTQVWVSA